MKLCLNKKFKIVLSVTMMVIMFSAFSVSVDASSDSATKTLPSNYGKLRVNVWREFFPTSKGNTYRWDYQVSSNYLKGKNALKVKSIKIKWQGGATLRKGASVNLGLSGSGVSVGSSSSYKFIKTKTKYWENTNGATTAYYDSNEVVAPASNYEWGSIYLAATGILKLRGDARSWSYSAAV